jgi:hypothetical protein
MATVQELQRSHSRHDLFLLECPFCGEPPKVSKGSGGQVAVECVSAECPVHPRMTGKDEREVASQWNRRGR